VQKMLKYGKGLQERPRAAEEQRLEAIGSRSVSGHGTLPWVSYRDGECKFFATKSHVL
jgi:hypothetical protein